MITIEITYNGKKYNEIGDAITQAVVDIIKNNFEESIKPFTAEIEQHNGCVNIDIPTDFKNAKISFVDLPPELISRITDALHQ
jgi:hypothetical protein